MLPQLALLLVDTIRGNKAQATLASFPGTWEGGGNRALISFPSSAWEQGYSVHTHAIPTQARH